MFVVVALLFVSGCVPAGSWRLESFISLGSRPLDIRHAELGTDRAQELYRSLTLDRAKAALENTPPPGRRGFAFVLTGCAEDSAVLAIDGTTLTAKAVGAEEVACATANYFLATFSVDQDRVPPTPQLKP